MAAAATVKEKWAEVPDGMKGPLIFSAIFHIGLVIVAITGLPYFKRPPEPLTTAIPIEILPISEVRTTNRKPVETKPAPEEEVKEKPPEKIKTPPKVDAVEPPKEVTPPKPKADKPKPKPVIPPPPTEKLEKPKPPEEKPKEEPKEEDTQAMANLLKNLAEEKNKVDEDLPESKDATPPAPAPVAAMGETMTMTDMDALSQQLQRCWSIQAGARYAEDLIVKVRLTVSPDRHATSATVVDQWRYSQDSYFRAAADAAIRAVNSPQCETLILPPDKYDQWKDLIVTFDPTDML